MMEKVPRDAETMRKVERRRDRGTEEGFEREAGDLREGIYAKEKSKITGKREGVTGRSRTRRE